MTFLQSAICQQHTPETLAAAVRSALGKPLRRATVLTQLALTGALACIPVERRALPTALLWQSTRGPRLETLKLLDEVCTGSGEPMPYDFLATQPSIAAAQIQPFLPGLKSATYCPLDRVGQTTWCLLLNLADLWLQEERYAQILCAQLDVIDGLAEANWLALTAQADAQSLARLVPPLATAARIVADTPDFPRQLTDWLQQSSAPALQLQSPADPSLAVEFARIFSLQVPDHVPIRL